MRKRINMIVLAIVVAVAFIPAGVFAAKKTVKMTAYDQVVKSGKTVYCAGSAGIYKVKVKRGKVKSVKKIYKVENSIGDSCAIAMKKKGNYLYFEGTSFGSVVNLYRVGTSGKKLRHLAYMNETRDYVIKGKRIYYNKGLNDNNRPITKQMKLNGKGKKKASVKVVLKTKRSNVKGYSVKIKTKGKYNYDYLRTPKGMFYLGKAALWYSE